MPTATFTYSQTGDFGYNAGQETKTVEWVISSSLPIQGGTFLDGSPWVLNNGDINLISTSPASANVPIKVVQVVSGIASIATLNVDINNTVINPDLGKVRASDDKLIRADNSDTTTAAGVFVPWDGRAGRTRGSIPFSLIGEAYDPTQKWDRQPKRLSSGDMVAVAVSEYAPPLGTEAILTPPTTTSASSILLSGVFDGVRSATPSSYNYLAHQESGVLDFIGCLTVVSSPPPPRSFRPPCNWDPLDRANAPIFQEVDNLEGMLLDYPNYSIDSNTKTWTQTAYQKFSSNPRYGNLDPYKWHYTVDPSNMRGYREHRLSTDPQETDYGSTVAKSLETVFFTMHTSDTPLDVRYRLRRIITQKGIDLYGARASLGKGLYQNGGHANDNNLFEVVAALVTGSSRIRESLNGISRGNQQNGTYKRYSDYATTNRKQKDYPGTSHLSILRQDDENFICPNRWKDLTIKQILTGTHPTHGPYQVVRVQAPDLLNPGATFAEDPTRIATWNRNGLYNVCTDKPTTSGRWNCANNTALLIGSYFLGGYLKSGNNITRIIKAKGLQRTAPSNLTLQQYEAGYTGSARNDDLLLWTQSDIFNGSDTTVSMAPNIKEDIVVDGVPGHFRTTTYEFSNVGYQNGGRAYTYATISFMPLWAYYHDIFVSKGIPVPYVVETCYQFAKWLGRDYLGLWTYFSNVSTVYNEFADWYLAMFRKLLASDPSQPMPVPWLGLNGANITTSYFQGKIPNGALTGNRAAWTALPETMTWIDFADPPPNITVASDRNYRTDINQVYFYRENETTSVGQLKPCQLKRDTENPDKYIVEVRSSTQFQPRLDYSHVENKTLYIWAAGATKPIKMKKRSETIQSTSWTQIWEFPEDKKHLPEFYINFSVFNSLRLFFADEDPRFDEQLSFAEQLARLLGSWGSNNSTYDLNEDGIVDSADLSILLSQWNTFNNQRILVFASPAGDAYTYEEVAIDTYVKLEGTGRDGIYKVTGKYSDNKTFSNGLKYTILEFGPRLRSVKGANIVTVRPPIQQEAV